MSVQYLERENGGRIAYHKTEGTNGPTVLFCGGFRSDMEGTKALYFEQQAKERGQPYIRFDYSGHGVSDGKFEEGSIGDWANDTMAVIDDLCDGDVVVVGSSMGGWIALILSQKRADRLAGIVGIAAAPDFTRDMVHAEFTEDQLEELQANGFVAVPNAYSDEPYVFTKKLIDDGEENCVLDKGYSLKMPVRLVQGMKDEDVEWQTAHRIKNAFDGDVEVFLVESGDHRLSRPEDLALIDEKIRDVSGL